MYTGYIEPTFASRLKVAVSVAIYFTIYVATEIWWQPFMAFVREQPICEQKAWLRGIGLAFALLFWIGGLSATRAAVLTFRSGQSPFPEAWVWSRTPVRTDWRAKFDGYLYASIAAVFYLGPLVAAYSNREFFFYTPASCI